MKTVKQILVIVLATVAAIYVVAIFIKWSDARDQALEKANNVYVACIQAQYHTSPSGYYGEHGVYPDCNE